MFKKTLVKYPLPLKKEAFLEASKGEPLAFMLTGLNTRDYREGVEQPIHSQFFDRGWSSVVLIVAFRQKNAYGGFFYECDNSEVFHIVSEAESLFCFSRTQENEARALACATNLQILKYVSSMENWVKNEEKKEKCNDSKFSGFAARSAPKSGILFRFGEGYNKPEEQRTHIDLIYRRLCQLSVGLSGTVYLGYQGDRDKGCIMKGEFTKAVGITI